MPTESRTLPDPDLAGRSLPAAFRAAVDAARRAWVPARLGDTFALSPAPPEVPGWRATWWSRSSATAGTWPWRPANPSRWPTTWRKRPWPLLLHTAGGFDLSHLACDGLEFESADRFGEQVTAAGGAEAWKAMLDADPRQWAERVRITRQLVTAMLLSVRDKPRL